MDYEEVMAFLEEAGTEQNRKIYRRHGSGDKLFGVSFADLKKVKKKIRINHPLALHLWDSGNVDARSLATMIIDPARVTESLADAWVRDIQYYLLADLLAGNVVGKTPFARKKMEEWIAADGEYIEQAGWSLVAQLALAENDLTDDYFQKYLKTIESGIRRGKNRVRHSMNMALIAIGLRNDRLEKSAVTSATTIGRVEVDHGETSCKTPDAIGYIKRARDRKVKLARKRT